MKLRSSMLGLIAPPISPWFFAATLFLGGTIEAFVYTVELWFSGWSLLLLAAGIVSLVLSLICFRRAWKSSPPWNIIS